MRKTLLIALTVLIGGVLGLRAQVTTEPSPLQEDSKDVVIYFHADEGNKGLMGQGPTAEIYAHTGVLTSSSQSDSDWKYAPTWGSNLPKYKLEYVSANLWKLNIGDIRTYYGITSASETVKSLCFVFRTADNSKEGKGAGNKDIIVPVLESGLQIFMNWDLEGDVITPDTANVTFSVGTTEPAEITLQVASETVATATGATSLTYTHFFENPGNKTIVVRATAVNAEGKKKTIAQRFTYAESSPVADYPGGKPKMGTVRNPDGSVTFCLAAPRKVGVYLLGSWNGFEAAPDNLMNQCTVDGLKYFWLTVPGLDADKPYTYCYLVDGKYKVGDPYARLVLDPDNDKYISPEIYPDLPAYPSEISGVALAVYQENLNDYDWKVKNFKGADPNNLVIYELLFRDFTGTEGQKKGDGTVRLAMEKIPYLKSLGINAVELLPINEFNGNISWGYNPNFYFAPDKAYGTPDDYKAFIDECHANGIAVILDVVFNQSDWQHPWYKMYSVGENPFYNAVAPHAYSVLNDWNQGYPLVRQQWIDVVQYWMREYNIDGYRFDLVKGLGDNDSYANNGDSGTNAYNASRVANMKYIKEAVDAVNPNAYFINENLAGAKEENEMAALGMLNWANVNYNGCQFAKGNSSNAGLTRFYAPLDGSRKWGSTVSYLESHDEQRLAYEQNQSGLTGVRGDLDNSMHRLGSAAAQMIMVPGSHMIWQFSEMGNYDSTKNSNGGNNTDPKTVRWNLLDEPERKGLVDNYAALINIRLNNLDLFEQSAEFVDNCNNWKAGRYLISKKGDKELVTVINPMITEELTINVPFASDNQDDYSIMECSYNTTSAFNAKEKTVTVPANCFVVIGTKNISSAVETVSAASGLMVRGGRGVLTVDYAPSRAEVFAANGMKVAVLSAGSSSVELPAGIYMVRSANETRKVAVK